jgi:hypothetical protein
MHNLADFEASRQHREEMARQIAGYRLGRRSRSARRDEGHVARLAGLLGRRFSGMARAAG